MSTLRLSAHPGTGNPPDIASEARGCPLRPARLREAHVKKVLVVAAAATFAVAGLSACATTESEPTTPSESSSMVGGDPGTWTPMEPMRTDIHTIRTAHPGPRADWR